MKSEAERGGVGQKVLHSEPFSHLGTKAAAAPVSCQPRWFPRSQCSLSPLDLNVHQLRFVPLIMPLSLLPPPAKTTIK